MLTTLLMIFLDIAHGAPEQPVTTTSFTCVLDGERRYVDLEDFKTYPCVVYYQGQVIYYSQHDRGYCRRKFSLMRKYFEWKGFTCKADGETSSTK